VLPAVAVFGLALAAGIAYQRCDARVARFFFDAEIPPKTLWLMAIGEMGRPLAPIFLLLLWAWAEKRPRLLLAGLLAMLLTLCAVQPIKMAVGRIRPDQVSAEVLKEPFYRRSYSFPSGDATLAFGVAVVAASAIPASARWIPFVLAAMVGMTRLMLLRHYASDVLAGAALGILCGFAALRISRSAFARRTLSRAPPKYWRPIFGLATVLFLIGDALMRGPVLKNFLIVFWPAVMFVLLAVKVPACLRRIGWPGTHWRNSVPMRIAVAVWYVLAGLACGCAFFVAMGLMNMSLKVHERNWFWFLPAAATALIGFGWAAPAIRRGLPAVALGRMYAAAVLSLGLSWDAFATAMQYLGLMRNG
jgi:undecaprenyl-diphosphatase